MVTNERKMTVTATEEKANTIVKYRQQHGFLLITQVLKFRLGAVYITLLRGRASHVGLKLITTVYD